MELSMDKVISTRLNESIVYQIDALANQLNTSKKNIIEQAVSELADRVNLQRGIDVFNETCGAWKRDESPNSIRKEIKKQFQDSIERHHK